MNEVSIIINGVRYDAVEATENFHNEPCDKHCDLCEYCDEISEIFHHVCKDMIGSDSTFKKSTKSFEK